MKITNTKYKPLNLATEDDRSDNFALDFILSFLLGVLPSLILYKNLEIALITYTVIRFLYYFVSELFYGRTIGKLDTQTVVVNINNSKPNGIQIFKRTIARSVGLLSGISDDEVAIHDKFSHTFVVKDLALKRIEVKSKIYLTFQLFFCSIPLYYLLEDYTNLVGNTIYFVILSFWSALLLITKLIKKLR